MLLLEKNTIEVETPEIKKEMLSISPSIKAKFTKIYLSESKSSWITIEWLSDGLIHYSSQYYQTLFDIHPSERGKIVMFNNEEFISPRWHRSYLHQPVREPNQQRSYMYSGLEKFENLELPVPFQKFLNFLNDKGEISKYNQVIVNWYANGKDYIAAHSDCQNGIVPDTGITIITLCEDQRFPRELNITPKKLKNEVNDNLYSGVTIKLQHGCIITMHGETQNYFRHGVLKSLDNLTSRISLTFRKFHQQ